MSPTLSGSQDGGGVAGGATAPVVYDQQFVVVASEKQCRVMTLPSQNCIFKQQITDTDYVIKAEIINLKGECVWLGLGMMRPSEIIHLSIRSESLLSYVHLSADLGKLVFIY